MAINLRQEYDDLVGIASADADTIFYADQGSLDNFKDFEMISWNDSDYPIPGFPGDSGAWKKTIDINYVKPQNPETYTKDPYPNTTTLDLNSFGNTAYEMDIYTDVLDYFQQFTSTKDNLNKVNGSKPRSAVYEYELANITRDVNQIHLYNDQILKETGNYWVINPDQQHATLKKVDEYLINIDANITYDNARNEASEA